MLHGYGFSKISDLSCSDKLGARSHVCSQSELLSEVVSLFRKPLLCMKLAIFLKLSGIISTNSSRPDRADTKEKNSIKTRRCNVSCLCVESFSVVSLHILHNCAYDGGNILAFGLSPQNSLTTQLLKTNIKLFYDFQPEGLQIFRVA